MRHPPLLFVLAVTACGHSEPFVTADQAIRGPFIVGEPMRLTYAPLRDLDPGFSSDGQWITYVFERASDRDRCIGILPVGGGTRTRDVCVWNLDEAAFKDGLAGAALRNDGTMLFVKHTGLRGNLTSTSMSLLIGEVDSIAGARELMPLGGRPAGATASWADLLDPVWVGENEVLVLATRRKLHATRCPPIGCPFDRDRTPTQDTVRLGVEIARLRVHEGQATVLQTIPAFDAIAWSLDPGTGVIHYVVQSSTPDDADGYHESIADTVFAVPATGGTPTFVFGVKMTDLPVMTRIHGIATGGGRVFISRSWRLAAPTGPIPLGTPMGSDIAEVLADGTLQPIAEKVSQRWGRIRLSPDHRQLVAEAVGPDDTDLYLITLAP